MENNMVDCNSIAGIKIDLVDCINLLGNFSNLIDCPKCRKSFDVNRNLLYHYYQKLVDAYENEKS